MKKIDKTKMGVINKLMLVEYGFAKKAWN